MVFDVSGVEVAWWVPPLLAFVIGTIVSTGGLSGAFVLLPFQVSVLGFTSPAVTPTNHLYNTISIPSGVYRYLREGRMNWPLAIVITCGTLPGVAVGSWVRVRLLPDPAAFKFFVGWVLLLISGRMMYDTILRPAAVRLGLMSLKKDTQATLKVTPVSITRFDWRRIEYSFSDESFGISTRWLFGLSTIVGVIGGAYGVGGGAIIAPFLVTVFGLPVYTIAGATLFGTFLTSAFGVVFFTLLAPLYGGPDLAVSPDWKLGALFGIGGFAGIYLGARFQRFVPQRTIKAVLGTGIFFLAMKYIVGFFLG